MNYFDLPDAKTWLRFFGWVAVKLFVSLLQFLLVAVEKILEFSLWCTKQFRLTIDKVVLVIDHMPYTGIPLNKHAHIEAIQIPVLPVDIKINFFDFTEFRNQPDKFPHIRVIGKTGVGKTKFTEWIMEMLGGEQFVITPKKKPVDWRYHQIYGYPFNYTECENKLLETHQLMHQRYALMEQGINPHQINFACDEWKLINKNVPSAKELMKDIIIVARDAKIRLIALAQGENVATWGLEGESDLEECFTTVRFGEFASDHCKFLRNKYRKDSDEFQYYSAVLQELDSQGFRCCMVEKQPARVPNLASFQPSFKTDDSQLQSVNLKVVNKLHEQLYTAMDSQPETTLNHGFQPQKPNFSEGDSEALLLKADRTLWLEIKTALDAGRSVDWCSKNLTILPGNYYSARKIVEDLINLHNQSDN